MFDIGQDVVCINDVWIPEYPNTNIQHVILPIKGLIYKIRGCDGRWGENRLFLVFEEIINLPLDNEPAFLSTCFRPIQKRESSAGIIRGLLTPIKQREDA